MNINELTIKVNDGYGISVEHQEYECDCEPVDARSLREQIHLLVDGSPNTVWSDGYYEEPATRVYLTFDGIPKLVEDLDSLVRILNSHPHTLWEITIEDNFLKLYQDHQEWKI